MTSQEAVVNIKVTAEDGSIKMYSVDIIKESSDTGIQSITVDGKSAILTDEDTYYVTATPGVTEVTIKAIATNQYAYVQIDTSEKSIKENTFVRTLPNGNKVVSIPIIITAQNNVDTKTYTLEIEQISNNTNISKLTVNNSDVTSTYDEVNKKYTMIIDNSVDVSNIYVETENEQATVKIDTGDLNKHTATAEVTTISDENIFTITVIAEDGTVENRDLVIKKLSQDATIIKLYVNNKEIEPNDDGTYTAEVLESIKSSDVRVKTTNENTTIAINNETATSKGDATVSVDTTTAKVITVPIKITAEDTTIVKDYVLTINMVSDIKDLEYVKVNSTGLTEYDEKSYTYKAFIPNNSTSATIDIKALSEYATLRIDSLESKSTISYTAETENDITNVNVDVVAEDGSVRTYTIVLQKFLMIVH